VELTETNHILATMESTLAQNHYVIQLPITPITIGALSPRDIAQQWLTKLEREIEMQLDTCTPPAKLTLSELFHTDSWWRDTLALDWDLRTIHTVSEIEEYISRNQPRARLTAFRLQYEGKFQPKIEEPVEGLRWISSMFFFESRVGRGTGVLRLTQDEAGVWKAYSLYTSLQELKGFDEPMGLRRSKGTIESMPGSLGQGNWLERRQRQFEFQDEEPTVLLVGAGTYFASLQSDLLTCRRTSWSEYGRSVAIARDLMPHSRPQRENR
jgi:hypothetical protein